MKAGFSAVCERYQEVESRLEVLTGEPQMPLPDRRERSSEQNDATLGKVRRCRARAGGVLQSAEAEAMIGKPIERPGRA